MIPAFTAIATATLLSSAPPSTGSQTLPYAPRELIFQSADSVKQACAAFEASAAADLDHFVQLSKQGDYNAAYQTWSDLLFRFFSFQLELGKTLGLSSSEDVKTITRQQQGLLSKAFQQKLSEHPALLATFLNNAKEAVNLTPQQRLFTESILQECQSAYPKKADQIAASLQKLSTLKTESFTFATGLATPLKAENLSELKVLTANIACFPGNLPYMYGGVSPWKDRIDRLVETICKTEAQIVFLQEVWDPEAMRAFADALKTDYACFVYDAGDPAGTLNIYKMGYNSGLFIASKLPLDDVAFNRFPRSIPEGSNRGAIIATCRVAQDRIALMNTHLQHAGGPPLQVREMVQVRKEQILLCYAYLQEVISRTLPNRSWGFMAGDLNVDAYSPEFNECGLPRLFSIPYTAHLSDVMAAKKEKITWTDYFNDLVVTPLDQRDKVPVVSELIDYCCCPTLSAVLRESTQTLIPLFSIDAPMQALSDHKGLLTTWKIPSSDSLEAGSKNEAESAGVSIK